MRYLLLFSLAAISSTAQPFSFGLKGGVPLTDFLNAEPLVYQTHTNRYIIGPTVELRLPFGFSVEVDALYRHLNYTECYCFMSFDFGSQQGKTTGNDWEFPLLAKYRFHLKAVRPYVDAGIAWETLTGLSQTTITENLFGTITSTTTTSHPPEVNQDTTAGFVIGGGIDLHALVIHISPELRYTRWGSAQFGGGLSHQNQAEFVLGITF